MSHLSDNPGYKANLKTLNRAAINGDLALVECTERATGKPAILVCAVHRDNGEYVISPLARMIDGDPYEDYLPPTAG